LRAALGEEGAVPLGVAGREVEPALHVDAAPEPGDWEDPDSLDLAADDAQWGADSAAQGFTAAQARTDADADAADALATCSASLSLAAHLQRQALSLRLSPPDRAALTILI
ncbi:MAG: hypothetical protein ACK56I_24060, partial [bacterium]